MFNFCSYLVSEEKAFYPCWYTGSPSSSCEEWLSWVLPWFFLLRLWSKKTKKQNYFVTSVFLVIFPSSSVYPFSITRGPPLNFCWLTSFYPSENNVTVRSQIMRNHLICFIIILFQPITVKMVTGKWGCKLYLNATSVTDPCVSQNSRKPVDPYLSIVLHLTLFCVLYYLPIDTCAGREEPWPFFHFWGHHLWTKLASSILNFCWRKRPF